MTTASEVCGFAQTGSLRRALTKFALIVLAATRSFQAAEAAATEITTAGPQAFFNTRSPPGGEQSFAFFRFGDEIFRVPKNLLIGGSDTPRPNEPGFFTLWALLPDFSPRTPDNTKEFDRVGFGNKLMATVHYQKDYPPSDEALGRFLEMNRKDKNDFQIKYGFQVYDIGTGVISQEIFTKKIFDRTLLVLCNSDRSVPHPGCSVSEKVTNMVWVQYFYSKSYIPEGDKIDAELRSLIGSFRIK